ncbi:MAG TPA: hypothetical protein DCM05_16235, partial [Elusimicrobia bacterium]|nr:hypothetical protein [Elusimicrobiota bacterium]
DSYLLRNDGGGAFTKAALAGTSDNTRGIAWGDYDNDGRLDLALSNYAGGNVRVLHNDGGGAFTVHAQGGTSGNNNGIAWGDYDNDGDLDLAVAVY